MTTKQVSEKRLANVNVAMIDRLARERLTIDHLLILECLYNKDYDILDKYDKNFTLEKALNNYQNLERKELIVPDNADGSYYIISLLGKELYEELIDLSNGIQVSTPGIRQSRDKYFDEFWDAYPATATWTSEDGRKFTSGRSLRTGRKEDNRKVYYKIINEGKYNPKQIIDALNYEIAAKKKQSLKTGDNHMQYMQGSLTWLNQRTFENFIGEMNDDSDTLTSYAVG